MRGLLQLPFRLVGCVKALRGRTTLLDAKQIGASAAYRDTPYVTT